MVLFAASRLKTAMPLPARRGFLNLMGMKNTTDADVNARINEQQRVYSHDMPLVFDNLGRYLIFDGLPFVLQTKPGTGNTLVTLASCFWAYNSYYAVPYVASSMYLSGTAAGFMVLGNIARIINERGSFSRIYLLNNRSVLRFESCYGSYQDLPISAVSFVNYNQRSHQLVIKVNSKNYILSLLKSPFFDPVILYAITNPMVNQIEGAVSNTTV